MMEASTTIPEEAAKIAATNGSHDSGILSADDLADRTRFRFREEAVEIPEIGGKVVLKSLSVREREMLPDASELSEVDDLGKRTEKALQNAAQTFSVIVVDPKIDPDGWAKFIGDWPAEAFDRITAAYGELVGTEGEVQAAADEFPGR